MSVRATAAGPRRTAMARVVAAIDAGGGRALEGVRARPRHACLALVAVALAGGPYLHGFGLAAAVAAAAALGALLAHPSRSGGALLAALLALAAALGAHARVAALEHTELAPLLGHAVREHVLVEDAPRADAYGGWSARARLRDEPVLLLGRGLRPAAGAGDGLHVQGVLRAPGTWARRLRMHADLRVTSVAASGHRRGGADGVVDGVRRRAEVALAQGLPPAQRGLLRGMVLGDDTEIPPAVREDFRASGLAHLVAASGTNVMLLATLAIAVATLVGLERIGRLTLALALIALYVPLAGAGPSIQRAGIMGAAVLVAALAGRPASRWYALGLAGAGTLLLDPRAVGDLGWQLSFAAVLGILLGAPRWRDALRRRGVPGGVSEVLAITAAAGLATAPVLAATVGEVSPVSLGANLLAAPAVAPVMWLGFVAAAVGQVSAAPAAVLVAVAGLPLGYLTWLADAAASTPWAVVGAGPVAAGAVCAAMAAVLSSRRARRLAPAMVSWPSPSPCWWLPPAARRRVRPQAFA
jgi:competence protein ComEC